MNFITLFHTIHIGCIIIKVHRVLNVDKNIYVTLNSPYRPFSHTQEQVWTFLMFANNQSMRAVLTGDVPDVINLYTCPHFR